MAKKKIVSLEEEIKIATPTPLPIDPIVETVRDLRSKGFDNNRIAARLGISSLIVKDIK